MEIGAQVVEAAWALSRLGLVTAYGHVSARSGAYALITPPADLGTVTPDALLHLPLEGGLPAGVPAEGWVHTAVYQARPDVGAVVRAMPPSVFAVGARVTSLPLVHGQAAWLGERVPVHDSAHLLRTPELAAAAAAELGTGEALLLRGNGAITTGATPGIAVARMWLLAAACDTYLAAGEGAVPLRPAEVQSWRAVRDELLPRLWGHLRRRTGIEGANVGDIDHP